MCRSIKADLNPSTVAAFSVISTRCINRSVHVFFLISGCMFLRTHLIFAGLPATSSGQPAGFRPGSGTTGTDVSMIQGRVAVKFRITAKKTMKILPSDPALAPYKPESLRRTFENPSKNRLHREIGLDRIHTLIYQADIPPDEAARRLSADPAVEYAVPLYRHSVFEMPDDSLISRQPHLTVTGLAEAWDRVKGEHGNVLIAIVDGGTEYTHEDLAANVWFNPGEIPGNGVDDDNNGFIDDVHGWNFPANHGNPIGLTQTPNNSRHGTHVAGIAAAVTNNQKGIAGSSWNCRYMAVNASDPYMDGWITYGMQGIVYAADNGASIVNCSWGRIGGPCPLESDVMRYALGNGVLIVAAAGNGGMDKYGDNNDLQPVYPANYRGVLSAGATEYDDAKTSFSNYGLTVDVFAPGADIWSTLFKYPELQYGPLSGTSMAAPFVSGAAGLLRTLHPDLTPGAVRERIRLSSDDIRARNSGYEEGLIRGRIHAARALDWNESPAIRITHLDILSSNRTPEIVSGDTVFIRLTVTNFLAPAGPVSVRLETNDPVIRPLVSERTLAGMASGETAAADFSLTLHPFSGGTRFFTIRTVFESGMYRDMDLFRFSAASPQFMNLGTDVLQTSITNQGNIGFIKFNNSEGAGFSYYGENYLFEGGLMIGKDSLHLSDCIRGSCALFQDKDFNPAPGEPMCVDRPGKIADEEGTVILTDSLAGRPLGIRVIQKTYAFNQAIYNNLIVFEYRLVNTTADPISGLYAGLFFDWDIGNATDNASRLDPDRDLAWVQNRSTDPDRFAGIRVLTKPGLTSFRTIDNPSEIYDGFPKTKKWRFLSGGIQDSGLDNTDVSLLTATGPLTINPGDTLRAAFAVFTSHSRESALQAAENARALWDNVLTPSKTGIAANDLPERFRLYPPYPNPFNPETRIQYALSEPGQIVIRICNIRGRQVYRYERFHSDPGIYSMKWDGRDALGMNTAGGVYLLTLYANGNRIDKQKLVKLK